MLLQQRKKKRNSAKQLLLFIIWPLLALIVNIKHYRTKDFQLVALLFFAYFGYVFVTALETSDVYRYAILFDKYAKLSIELKLSFFEDRMFDLFRPVSFFVVSLFTNDARIFLAFVATIYGYYYLKLFRIITLYLHASKAKYAGLFVISWLFTLSITGFQFIRFNTAEVVFIYAAAEILLNGNRGVKTMANLVLACLIHFSLVLPVICLLFYTFIYKNKVVLFYLFVITFFVQFVEFNALADLIAQYLPEILDEKKGYLNKDLNILRETELKTVNWYILYRPIVLRITLLFLLFPLIHRRSAKSEFRMFNLLNFALFLGVIGNIASIIPSGGRFLGIAIHILWLICTIAYLAGNLKLDVLRSIIVALVLIYNIIVGTRFMMDGASIELIFGNPIFAYFSHSNIPLIDYIKDLLM